ncbi:MAG: isoprenoid biosynthesis glyoxalase ElbB [Bacteroidetes bacterium]|nr:isoprenoid biosynthesis glyoxalase ElbB [Bacteroidota bacterium]
MKKFAVILAGCGVFDGAEIHEAVLTLLAIQKLGGRYQIFAPDIWQHHVVNHITGEEMPEKRNVLIESARIARGSIKDLKTLHAEDFDGVIFPGGFGVAKNLCNWAFKGPDCEVNPLVARVIKDTLEAGKPIGAMCIAPVLLGKVLGAVDITIGADPGDARKVEQMGSHHVNTTHGQVVKDKNYKIFTTPCYQLAANLLDIAMDTELLVKEMMDIQQPRSFISLR